MAALLSRAVRRAVPCLFLLTRHRRRGTTHAAHATHTFTRTHRLGSAPGQPAPAMAAMRATLRRAAPATSARAPAPRARRCKARACAPAKEDAAAAPVRQASPPHGVRTHARAREGRGEGEGQLAGRSAKGAQRAVWRTHARTRARGRNQGLVQCRAAPLPATTPCTARPSRHAPRAQADARPCPAVRVWRALPPKSGRALSAKELLGEDDAPKQKPDESFMVRPARPACALARARRAAPRPINQPRVRRRERG